MQIPIKKKMHWQEDVSHKVMGSSPSTGKGFYRAKYLSESEARNSSRFSLSCMELEKKSAQVQRLAVLSKNDKS